MWCLCDSNYYLTHIYNFFFLNFIVISLINVKQWLRPQKGCTYFGCKLNGSKIASLFLQHKFIKEIINKLINANGNKKNNNTAHIQRLFLAPNPDSLISETPGTPAWTKPPATRPIQLYKPTSKNIIRTNSHLPNPTSRPRISNSAIWVLISCPDPKMGALSTMLKHPDDIYPLLKLKIASRQIEKQIPAEPHWAFCYTMLQKVSRSFALVIQQLGTELRNAVS